ncbi:hypothetical protein D3C77_440430 [compost metagenome]
MLPQDQSAASQGGLEKLKANKLFYSITLLTAVVIAVLWSSGLFGLWSDGIAFLANNTKEFTDENGHLVEGKYSLEVNLSDLESNIGKEIYNDGDHRIYVSWLQRIHNGGYDIGFRFIAIFNLLSLRITRMRKLAFANRGFLSLDQATFKHPNIMFDGAKDTLPRHAELSLFDLLGCCFWMAHSTQLPWNSSKTLDLSPYIFSR